MKANLMTILVAEVFLGATGLAAMAYGRMDVCYMAVGAFVGVLGGHLNGTHDTASVPELEDKIAMIEATLGERIAAMDEDDKDVKKDEEE